MAYQLIQKVLIANRGEIACRVMQTAKRLGISCVSVYSEADRNALHVAMSDEAYCVGPAASALSYLNKDKIIEITLDSGAKAVHPGYGFLSENADFAEICKANKVKFIGPPSSAIRAMGSKSESKRLMENAGVPVVPGYHGEEQDVEFLRKKAEEIGYPVLIKAVMGGGGKGMKLATSPSEFFDQLESAKREALKSFGDERVILEKFITSPRHIEFQVFCDSYGNAVHLFERDCSVQRRHQKVIEEAPSLLEDSLRAEMGQKAKQAALAVGYEGAGTVEFIFDEDTKNFYFMEMNTRLQVEHPVSEMITGQDLVEWQFRVASGFPLPLSQDQLSIKGHSLEARIYAEDPKNDFLPSSGNLLYLSTPQPTSEVRIDSGVTQGDEISVHYDPLIAKLIVWGDTRSQAMNLMHKSLSSYHICGLPTNISFLKKLVQNSKFRDFKFNTNFIPENKEELLHFAEPSNKDIALSSVCLLLKERHSVVSNKSPWFDLHNFRLNSEPTRNFHFLLEKDYPVTVTQQNNHFVATAGGEQFKVKGEYLGNSEFMLETDSSLEKWRVVQEDDSIWIINEKGEVHKLEVKQEEMSEETGPGKEIKQLSAPMPGKIVRIAVQTGDSVKENDTIVVLESMKMEHMIKVPRNAKVEKVLKKEGDFVKGKEVIITFE
mgnify:FL=1